MKFIKERADARELPPRARSAARARRFPAQRLGRGLERRADQAAAGRRARCISTPASSPGPAATPIPPCPPAGAPTTPCARRRWRCAPATRARPRRCSRTAPTPDWCRISSSRRCSTSPPTPASMPASPEPRAEWGELARRLGVKVIHIAERDTQVSQRAQGAGRVRQHLVGRRLRQRGLAAAPSSAGARTSAIFPRDGGRHDFGCVRGDLSDAPGRRHARAHLDAARPGTSTASDHARRGDLDRRLLHACARARRCVYRPTVHYAYHPCDAAVLSVHEFAGRNYVLQERKRIMHGRHHRAASTSSACCSPATRRTPTGTARSCRSRRRASSRPTTTPPACR